MRRRLAPAPAQTAFLLALPADCLQSVLQQLDPPSLARAGGTCAALLGASRERVLWRRHCLALWSDDPNAADAGPCRYARRRLLFRGVRLCCTGMPPAERRRAHALVAAMGGDFDCDLHVAGPRRCTHLLCGDTATEKTRAAWDGALVRSRASLEPRPHVVRPSWLDACVADALVVDVARRGAAGHRNRPGATARDFSAPPLLGAVVCCTGLSRTLRQAVEADVRALGGVYEASLTSRCTHLLAHPHAVPPGGAAGGSTSSAGASMGAGPKLALARRRRTPVVDICWLREVMCSRAPIAAQPFLL